ncbi:hypothetical protein AAA162_00005 [Parabacteroides johnsonii]|jgi:hypothetical protein|uniref:Glycoside hydrolase family 65 n=1 Tax=Parabacteroides johnsonii TaxID=387661 RepID=A0A9Q5X9C6_9BACT|nr:hypothetical protein [Parabacteroides johnsonii]OUO07161.1 hypothetical protein B5F96_00375 [Parabacteroides johnsonii]CCX77936.1 uncharacterized protein BN560_02243 [Parabacteroides johnsonii CAG:246]
MKKLISLVCLFCLSAFLPLSVMGEPIDREAVVKRHRVCTTGTLLKSPAQVGNGKFAFGMDITGLQTFVPFNTLSDWGWHSFPLPEGMKAEDYRPVVVETHGKKIAYELRNPDQPELSEWLTRNPHRYNLGRIGFRLLREDGMEAQEIDLGNACQEIDLWTGVVYSRFELNRKEVKVRTVCHPDKDMIGVSIESELLNDGNMSIYLDFPYPDGRYFKHYIGRYDTISGHTSTFEKLAPNSVRIARTMDDTHYYATLDWTGPATFSRESEKTHKFLLQPRHTSTFSFTCCFSPEPVINVTESVASIERKSAASWEKYWRSGAAVDLSGSKDPRWLELERRIVLSQYLMRANESGLFPPQESGLVNNGWFGRFHFEMIWWHGVHYGLWNRMECFDNYLNVYKDFMPKALERAKSEGRSGARWPKCTGNFNREWPGSAHAYLIWHEPHPIYFAEMQYRQKPVPETLEKWEDIVLNTADYMADYLFYDKKTKQYVLGPPVVVVSENTDPLQTINPIFELGYFRYGLRTALEWADRLGLSEKRTRKWKEVLSKMAPLPVADGVYTTYEDIPDMWTKYTYEHPALTGVYGMLPGDGVDQPTFKRTLEKVSKEWQFNRIWGWDFPMLAMAAARTGQPALAIDMLMHPSAGFQFDEHGLATGGPFPYFPSNGALLTAVAMMCGGWDGSEGEAPGFPKDGSWTVRYEGFVPMQ